MSNISVRYLVKLGGAGDGLPRYYWQPSAKLRAAGHRPCRVPDAWADHVEPGALEGAAIAAAQAINAALDATRADVAADVVGDADGAKIEPTPSFTLPRTLAELIVHYRASKRWRKLAPKTKVGYTQCLVLIEAWGGTRRVRALGADAVAQLADRMASTPSYANATVRVLRLLLEHGRRAGCLTVNPAMRPGLATAQPRGVIWPAGAVEAFVATADRLGWPSVGTAVCLNAWLGQRQADILRLPLAAVRGDILVLRQSKRGAGVTLPIGDVPHLVERLAGERARRQPPGQAPGGDGRVVALTVLVHDRTGRPWNASSFRHVFAEIRAELAATTPAFATDRLLPGRDMTDADAFLVRTTDLTFQVLRHTAVTALGEAGCELALIAAVSGHSIASVTKIMRVYLVRTPAMARAAFAKRVEAERSPPGQAPGGMGQEMRA
jgi:hypothetical protein